MIDLSKLSPNKRQQFAQLLQQRELERVSPKLEAFRAPCRIKGARGGRAAGAKSWSFVSLIVQRAHYHCVRVVCLREVQRSLEESAYALYCGTVQRLRYRGWRITDTYLSSPAGSKVIFRGLKDYRSVQQVKGLEAFDIFHIEEAAQLSMESWDVLLPTIVRRPGAELWFNYNPETEMDPVSTRIWDAGRDDALLIDLLPGRADNPWWNEGLQHEMELDFARDPDLAEHVWMGQPRKQGQYSIFSRSRIRAAMQRVVSTEGPKEIGVDVARFGDDKTVMYKREGMRVTERRGFVGQDTQRTAREAWDMAGRRPDIAIKVDDTGVGGGVTDKLKDLGALVVPVNFGEKALDTEKYQTVADEIWFEFPMDDVQIPDNPELMRQLSGRQYDFDKQNRKIVESKKKYKDRNTLSPDDADALLLTFYRGRRMTISEQSRKELAARRRA